MSAEVCTTASPSARSMVWLDKICGPRGYEHGEATLTEAYRGAWLASNQAIEALGPRGYEHGKATLTEGHSPERKVRAPTLSTRGPDCTTSLSKVSSGFLLEKKEETLDRG